jgi:tRNA dimethylallyltransferase
MGVVKNGRGKPKAIVVCGPTGVGKTGFAIEMARALKGEIVGADAMQVYRSMDIGTAKPTLDQRAMVRHHMVDVVDPDKAFDAETYAKLAFEIVKKLQTKGIPPFIVGGTGLYIKSLIYGLFDAGPGAPEIRKRLKSESEEKDVGILYERLKQCDPATAERLHMNDTYRIIRALEVYEATGKPISEFQERHRFQESRMETLKFGLRMEREILYDRINERVDQMLDAGLLREVKKLLASGYASDLKSMQSIGYRHMIEFIEGRVDWEEAVRTMKRDTRRYAKRQLTWFKADPEVIWVAPEDINHIVEKTRSFLHGVY